MPALKIPHILYRSFAKTLDFTVSQSASFTISAVLLSKSNRITPFAVVVRLIQVDSGGCFCSFAALGLFQRHGMDKPAFRQLQARLVKRPPVESLRATGGCTSKFTAKSSKVDCVDKGLTRPQVKQMAFRLEPRLEPLML